MSINTDKLPRHILKDVMQRMGWQPGEDEEPYRALIAKRQPLEVLRAYVAWNLGSEDWADFVLDAQRAIKEAVK